jgi:hypothetical protein
MDEPGALILKVNALACGISSKQDPDQALCRIVVPQWLWYESGSVAYQPVGESMHFKLEGTYPLRKPGSLKRGCTNTKRLWVNFYPSPSPWLFGETPASLERT